MLSVRNIETFYGRAQALFGVSLDIRAGEVVALMGRNGMGKTTLIHSIMGLTPIARGAITWKEEQIDGLPPYRIARQGIGLVPEGRQIFPTLTVRENLVAGAANHGRWSDPYTLKRVISIFPRLGERLHHRGAALSGGEQQMLAIGRALMTNPRLLLLDEATEGLAPVVCEEIWRGLAILRKRGLAILVVDKNIRPLLAISDRCLLMEKGVIVWEGTTPFATMTREITRRYLGV